MRWTFNRRPRKSRHVFRTLRSNSVSRCFSRHVLLTVAHKLHAHVAPSFLQFVVKKAIVTLPEVGAACHPQKSKRHFLRVGAIVIKARERCDCCSTGCFLNFRSMSSHTSQRQYPKTSFQEVFASYKKFTFVVASVIDKAYYRKSPCNEVTSFNAVGSQGTV